MKGQHQKCNITATLFGQVPVSTKNKGMSRENKSKKKKILHYTFTVLYLTDPLTARESSQGQTRELGDVHSTIGRTNRTSNRHF